MTRSPRILALGGVKRVGLHRSASLGRLHGPLGFRRILIGVLTLAALLPAASAHACAQCAWSLTWLWCPAVEWWAWIIPAWYVALSLIAAFGGFRLGCVYSPKVVIPIVALLGLFGTPIWGPVTVYLLVPCVIGWIWAFSLKPKHSREHRAWLAVHVTGAVAVCLLAGTFLYAQHARAWMDDADIILKWEGTPVERQLLAKLIKAEPASVPLYRKVLQKGEWACAGTAARRLAEVGDPKVDVPLMIDAIERLHRRSPDVKDPFPCSEIEQALGKASGLGLPEHSVPDAWRRAWLARRDTPTTSATAK